MLTSTVLLSLQCYTVLSVLYLFLHRRPKSEDYIMRERYPTHVTFNKEITLLSEYTPEISFGCQQQSLFGYASISTSCSRVPQQLLTSFILVPNLCTVVLVPSAPYKSRTAEHIPSRAVHLPHSTPVKVKSTTPTSSGKPPKQPSINSKASPLVEVCVNNEGYCGMRARTPLVPAPFFNLFKEVH